MNSVESSFGGQLMGMMAFLPLAFLPGYIASWCLKKLNLLRVPPEVELEGLDMAEFQQDFFPEFERVPETIVLPDGEEVDSARSSSSRSRRRTATRRRVKGAACDRQLPLRGKVRRHRGLLDLRARAPRPARTS